MNVQISSTEKSDYLLIISKGKLENEDDLFAHAHMIYEEIAKYDQKKILLEQTGTHFPKKLFSYLDLVKEYQSNFPPEISFLKIACVVLPEYMELGKFWETASVNRGFQFFIFTSLEDAEAFLLL